MVVDFAATQHWKASARNTTEQLEQSSIARTIDARRSDDRHFDAGSSAGFSRDLLPFELRVLIDVARAQRRIFVRRRMFDVSVHADGAAMHNPFCASPRGGFNDFADGDRIHGAIRRRRDSGLTVNCRNVIDDVDVLERCVDRDTVAKISDREVQTRGLQIARSLTVTYEDANCLTACEQAARQMAAGKSRRARD